MEKQAMKGRVTLLAAAVALVASGSAWSAIPGNENPLPGNYWDIPHKPLINMTNIDLSFSAGGKTSKGPGNSVGKFTGSSSSSSTFSLLGLDNSLTSFTGAFTIDASITSSGTLKSPGTFSFTSSDAMFGFGSSEKCRKGRCTTTANTGVVFAGSLTNFGWSESNGMLDFEIGNMSGWACEMGWCTPQERLRFDHIGANKSLGLPAAIGNVTNWSKTMNGTAVIPVPAAAWLFGSGLIGLLGVARRKMKAV